MDTSTWVWLGPVLGVLIIGLILYMTRKRPSSRGTYDNLQAFYMREMWPQFVASANSTISPSALSF